MDMKKIMLVDDEEDIRELLKDMLEKEGYIVTTADSGQKCLDQLSEGEKPELILLDVMMPGMDGWEVSKRIRKDKRLKDTTIAMLTVRSSDEDKIKSMGNASANWHIAKPIEKTKFLKTVKFLVK